MHRGKFARFRLTSRNTWNSPLYDNTKIAVAKILGGTERQRTRAFSELQSHYLFADKFGRPAKGNDKGKVEGLVGYARRNHRANTARRRARGYFGTSSRSGSSSAHYSRL